jgi:hypothetical protein
MELDPLKLPLRLQTAVEALYGHYEKTFKLWEKRFDPSPSRVTTSTVHWSPTIASRGHRYA